MADSVGQPPRDRRRRQRLDKMRVIGLPKLRFIEQLLDHLRAADPHPNRKLYFDDLFIALLLAFYNPVARSLRGVEDASQMPGINQHLDIEAIRRSTASDALAAFDPKLLMPLIEHLRERVSPRQMDQVHDDLRGMLNRLLIYDGSYFHTACDVGWALRERHGPEAKLRGRVRLNLHLSHNQGVPTGMSLAGAGDPGEPAAMLEGVEAGQIVVADRGCFSHEAVHQLRERGADFVLRVNKAVRCEVIAERTLGEKDREAGVLSDQTVLLSGAKNTRTPTPMRLVTIQPQRDADRHASNTSPPAPLRLLTSVQEETIPAWMIGHIYRRRWEIELFFRWLKCCAHHDHLISESRNGMLIQLYVAMIGTLLLAISTDTKPDRYAFNLMAMAATGQGTIEDAMAIYRRRKAERERDRKRRQERARQKTQS